MCQRHGCLQNTRVLFFFDPDSGKTFSVYGKNMEFRRGRGNGWFVLAVCSDLDQDDNEDDDNDNWEAFSLEVACDVIGDTPQAEGIVIVRGDE